MAVPATAVAKPALDEAARFWKGLLDALGKPAFTHSTTRKGRKVVATTLKIPAVTVTRTGKLVTKDVSVPRWVVAGAVVVGGGALLYETGKVTAAWDSVKGKLPSAPSIKPPAWNASNPLGWANVPAWFNL